MPSQFNYVCNFSHLIGIISSLVLHAFTEDDVIKGLSTSVPFFRSPITYLTDYVSVSGNIAFSYTFMQLTVISSSASGNGIRSLHSSIFNASPACVVSYCCYL
jgi:hypothetical protein